MINDKPSFGKNDAVVIGASPRETAIPANSTKGIDRNDKHLRTDHLLADLKGRAISSAFVTIAAQGARFGLQLASIMVLARLLTPESLGLFAMVATLLCFLVVFQDTHLNALDIGPVAGGRALDDSMIGV